MHAFWGRVNNSLTILVTVLSIFAGLMLLVSIVDVPEPASCSIELASLGRFHDNYWSSMEKLEFQFNVAYGMYDHRF